MKRKENTPKYHEANKEHIHKYKMAHMVGVAEYMRNNAKKYSLNPDMMYVVGLLHDIGYLEGRRHHEEFGAELLKETFSIGFNVSISNDIYQAIKLHGTSPKQILDKSKLQNDVLLLLYEADQQIDAEGHFVGFNGRLNDIKRRYGEDSVAYQTSFETIEFVKSELEKRNLRPLSRYDVEYFDIHPYKFLEDYYSDWDFVDGIDGFIEINGSRYQYEMTLSSDVSDDLSKRVFIDGDYFYFS